MNPIQKIAATLRERAKTCWHIEWTKQDKEMADALDALAAQSEPVAISTDDDVEALARQCGWDNRRYMTPADYSEWCRRMRLFARIAAPQRITVSRQDLKDHLRDFRMGFLDEHEVARALGVEVVS